MRLLSTSCWVNVPLTLSPAPLFSSVPYAGTAVTVYAICTAVLSTSVTWSAALPMTFSSPWVSASPALVASIGLSLTDATFTVWVTATLVPPPPSLSTARTVRASAEGASETLSKVTLRSSTCAAAGVAEELSVTTSGVEPFVPPVNVPMDVPPKLTALPDMPICPALFPSLRIPRRSSAVPFAVRSTVNCPPFRLGLSASVTVAPASICPAPPPSVKLAAPPGRVTTGLSLGLYALALVAP